jgi:hypothetical protein
MIKTHWYVGNVNFGEMLVPEILRLAGIEFVHAGLPESELMLIGSTLSHTEDKYSGTILGSGLQFWERKKLEYTKFLCVRGPLTRELLGLPHDMPLCDPGLLVSEWGVDETKKYDAYIILLSFIDKNSNLLNYLLVSNPDIHVIDIQQRMDKTLKEIAQSRHIISTSLHGMIAADALGVKNCWIYSPNVIGYGFKFFDYNLSVGKMCGSVLPHESLNVMISQMTVADPHRIAGMVSKFNWLLGEYKRCITS